MPDGPTENQEPDDPGLTERRFAENLRAARERAGVSQSALANRMRERRFRYHQQTIGQIEAGERGVRIGEAQALADELRTTVDALMRPAGMARDAYRILSAARRVREARDEAAAQSRRHAAERQELERILAEVDKAGNNEALADEIAIARYALEDAKEWPE